MCSAALARTGSDPGHADAEIGNMASEIAVAPGALMQTNAASDFRPTLPVFATRQSLREQIADALRAALVSGQMRPGLVYSVPVLAERFGISPTPVREAMLDLAKESLVEPVRNKGFRVTELTDKGPRASCAAIWPTFAGSGPTGRRIEPAVRTTFSSRR
jgi:DNA-binding transcriptional regulator YhcF (GntR family)